MSLEIISRKITWLSPCFYTTPCSWLAPVALQTKRRRFNLVLKAIIHVVIRWVVIVPTIRVGRYCRSSWHHKVLMTAVEHRSGLVIVGRWKLVLKASRTSLVHTRRAELWQCLVVWVVKTVIVREINSTTRCVETALTLCFELVLPFSFKVCAYSKLWSKKFYRIRVHKVLMHFTRWTGTESRLVKICYTFLLFHDPVLQCRVI